MSNHAALSRTEKLVAHADILIAIPTCMRPRRLARCLASMATLKLPPNKRVDLLVADNDFSMSARAMVENFSLQSPFNIYYTVAQERGLCHVRNHIFDTAVMMNTDYVATCDDDNAVSPEWLTELYSALISEQADSCEGVEINDAEIKSRAITPPPPPPESVKDPPSRLAFHI
ncbi:glycosyltransferase [Candidatus Spongiihabitans sp.]|uniref:glycosyltransferase n=1 Tax=Candidatus Spongiihabitans sp. TaxID=3101308 RepID=UPI003C7CD421